MVKIRVLSSKWLLTIAGIFSVLVFVKLLYWHIQISSQSFHDYGSPDLLYRRLRKPGIGAAFMNNTMQNHGLSFRDQQFTIDGHPITLISGAVHYFRFPREYWEDRLIKMKACGLNTIETYVPWNLHEPVPGTFDFSGDLNLTEFLLLAKRLDLYVLLRPGPYICSEWEFGGLPSWLLRDPTMKVRTMHRSYITAVEKYFKKLLSIVQPLQYKYGGPIIAFQLDNEYGSYFKDREYLPYLKVMMEKNNINELFFVSDNNDGLKKQTLSGVLKTVNFKHVENHLVDLEALQPNAPLMVMEFWTGWFDWWGMDHHTMSLQDFAETLNEILSVGASVNFYMFFGGTNFGFMNGAFLENNMYRSDITSYDYDAILAENGDLTEKYYKTKKIIEHYYPNYVPPRENFAFSDKCERIAYPSLSITGMISLWDILHLVPNLKLDLPLPMEMLNINNGAGQSYGYVLYSSNVQFFKNSKFVLDGFKNVFDRGMLYIDGVLKNYINDDSKEKPVELVLNPESSSFKLDLLVENGGRVNWEEFDSQRKGILGPILFDDFPIRGWTVYPLEMKSKFIDQLVTSLQWSTVSSESDTNLHAPTFFKAILDIDTKPQDTYINMQKWGKGVVFVNGKNLGRYWSVGPQLSLFLPAPWLKEGKNVIVIFEETNFHHSVKFEADP